MSAPDPPIDRFARSLSPETRAAVLDACASETRKRADLLARDFETPARLRRLAGLIKQHALDHLDGYLAEAETNLTTHGAVVHHAADGASACRIVAGILSEAGARRVVKSKSMATEEVGLNAFLAERGVECVETDLGELIVQLDGDRPSHLVKPIIHKDRRQVARCFERSGLGAYDDDPERITRRARRYLRQKYFQADAGITGANFISAESGRLVIVTNEGNARFSLAPVDLHIALVGVEKIVPKDRDLAVLLRLLGRSATGQRLTVYTQFIAGPRAPTQPSGPRHLHVVLLDNGRWGVRASRWRPVLRCIRCGACQNVCPVFRQATGHAYRAVYGGPVGAVLTPLLAGDDFARYADLPFASTLCGACREVCPVDIPIPELLLRLRHRAVEERAGRAGRAAPDPQGTRLTAPRLDLWAAAATRPRLWRALLRLGRLMNWLPATLVPVGALRRWLAERTLPTWRGGRFRRWWRRHPPKAPPAGPPNAATEDITAHPDRPDPATHEPTPYPDYPDGTAIPRFGRGLASLDEAKLWEIFREHLESAGGRALESTTELDTLLLDSDATMGYCDPALEDRLRPMLSPSISLVTEFDRARHEDLEFGITRATGWIAETGTLVLEDQQTSDRLGALSPWIHVAVVDRETRRLATLETAIAAFGRDPNIVWVTGPSKTADVEGILIEGVHGPGVQMALRLT